MSDRVIYLCFTTWVEMRAFIRARRLNPADVHLAHLDNRRWLPVAEHRIALVRSNYVPIERDEDRWAVHSAVARQRNHENDFETEIIDV